MSQKEENLVLTSNGKRLYLMIYNLKGGCRIIAEEDSSLPELQFLVLSKVLLTVC